MREIFKGFILSISFFTQIPILYHVKNITNKTYKYLALFIPLNGLLLSLIVIGLYTLLATETNQVFIAIFVSVFYLFMYGFLHLEAVADILDAYYAKHSGKNAYEILKDSHVGALGAIGTFSFVIVKVAGLSFLLIEESFLEIISVLVISRFMAFFSIFSFEFHKESKFIESLKSSIDKNSFFVVFIVLVIGLFFIGNLWLLLVAMFITWMLKIWLMKDIGFLNGDGLGFMIEINEVLLLSVLIIIKG